MLENLGKRVCIWDGAMGTQLQALSNWDSLALALILNLLREQYGCEVELHKLLACNTPQDLWQLTIA